MTLSLPTPEEGEIGQIIGINSVGQAVFMELEDLQDLAVPRSVQEVETGVSHRLDLQSQLRNDDGSVLEAAAASGTFGIVNGTHAAPGLYLETEAANSSTVTTYASAVYVLPQEYVAGSNITASLAIDTNGSGTLSTNTIDLQALPLNDAGTVGSDICATAAQNLNSTPTARDFTLTGTDLEPGDALLLYFTMVLTETAASNVTGRLSCVDLQFNTQG
jgi:hypothetical protein